MADTVTNKTVIDTPKEIIVHLTCISDGTGETNVVKIDKSTLVAVGGAAPTALNLDSVQSSINGFTYVKLRWNHTTPDTMIVLAPGNGYSADFTFADKLRDLGRTGGLLDPQSAGGTGNIELTSVGAAANATYDIILAFSKQA